MPRARPKTADPLTGEPDPRFLPLEVGPAKADALCLESPLSSLDSEITPTQRFFVRSHFPVPKIDPDTWRLTVDGEVERPRSWSLDEIRGLPHRDLTATMECAGNGRITVRPKAEGVLWGHGAVSTARWRGVSLRALLEEAGVRSTAVEVVFRGADRGREPGAPGEIPYEMSISVAKALDPDTLLVDTMNGAPLAPSHGFPMRTIVPGWYGMASVKWLSTITVSAAPFQGHFRSRAYAYIYEGDPADRPKEPVTTMRVKSLVTWPKEGAVLASGRHQLRGVAWSGDAAIRSVEVSTGPARGPAELWRAARLVGRPAPHVWVQWELPCDLPHPGFYVLRVRATDERGQQQPAQAEWNFRGVGNNSIHCVPIEVRAGSPPDPDPARRASARPRDG